MQSHIDPQDEPNDVMLIRQRKAIIRRLLPNEKILVSLEVIKYNHINKPQKRTLLLTNQRLFNLDLNENILSWVSGPVKRVIDIHLIQAVVLSSLSSEFVVKVPQEYDYRFSSSQRNLLLQKMNNSHPFPLAFFFLDDLDLIKHTTNKFQAKRGMRAPFPGRIMSFSPDELCSRLTALDQKQPKSLDSTTIDDFFILKVLGRGAYGKVLLVQNKKTQKLFALKKLRKDQMVTKYRIESVKQEKSIMETIRSHPFLLGLDHFFQNQTDVFLVTQFVRGGDLFNLLRGVPWLSEDRCRFYAAQVLLALEHLHSLHILYRDLKPENVLVQSSGYLTLADFGVSRAIDDKLATTMAGTTEYTAPEVLQHLPYHYPSDLWSLGCLIYEMATGLPPFICPSQAQTQHRIVNESLSWPDQPILSPPLQDLISGLLHKRPSNRLTLEQTKNHVWFSSLDFDLLYKMEIKPEFVPTFSSELDLTYFEDEFTQQDTKHTFVEHHLVQQHHNAFVDF